MSGKVCQRPTAPNYRCPKRESGHLRWRFNISVFSGIPRTFVLSPESGMCLGTALVRSRMMGVGGSYSKRARLMTYHLALPLNAV